MSDGSLSLPARLYLLAWDTSKSEVTGAAQVPQLVRAGALTELAQRGLLLDDDDIATPVDLDASTGDPVLDGLLELVRESRPHRWRSWVTLHARVTLDAVREQLTAGGYLRARKKRALGLFPTVDHELARPAAVEALQEEARRILRGPADACSEGEAALGALAAAAELHTLGPRKDRDDAHVEELIERSGPVAPVLRKVVHEVRGAVTAAAVATRA
ncbi:GPP34 family phosphoprotein [Streptomyces sp. NPDC057253]|uniref:GOLPH3/VPS74 family protein n=1 Tax=Streptomyces sp. NPDC057253 TaxID=3346069 RepID=UPI0036381CDB